MERVVTARDVTYVRDGRVYKDLSMVLPQARNPNLRNTSLILDDTVRSGSGFK